MGERACFNVAPMSAMSQVVPSSIFKVADRRGHCIPFLTVAEPVIFDLMRAFEWVFVYLEILIACSSSIKSPM